MNGIKPNLKNNLPPVSVITTSFNQSRFIEENILSVLGQDYPDIEHIVVDGGSTDETIKILKRYDGRVKWVSEKDSGPEAAINKGLRMSAGAVLGVLNSDDTYLPGAVSKAVGFLAANRDVSMVYGKGAYIDKDGSTIGEYPTEEFNRARLAVTDFICQPAVFFNRGVFTATGGYSEELKFATDYELWLRITERFKVAYLPEFLAAYRLHDEAKNIISSNALAASSECLDIVMKYYGKAPANRVFAHCYNVLSSRAKKRSRASLFILTALLAAKEYVRLNRGVRLSDISMLAPSNLIKIFKGWELKDKMRPP